MTTFKPLCLGKYQGINYVNSAHFGHYIWNKAESCASFNVRSNLCYPPKPKHWTRIQVILSRVSAKIQRKTGPMVQLALIKSEFNNRRYYFADGNQISSGVVSSSQDELPGSNKRPHVEDVQEADSTDDEVSKRRKRTEKDEKEPMAKPAPVARGGPGR